MNSRIIFWGFWLFLTALIQNLSGYEIFIFRPYLKKSPLNQEQKITLHGEFFGYHLYPCTFPSYNDFSGGEDRWNFGFQNLIFLTDNTVLLAQLLTHDDGQKRTKFDWHFSLRQHVLENLVLIIGHDSNHDSDYQSQRNKTPFYLNRNYLGFGLPFKRGEVYIEPFTWFFHHTNQRGNLDYSGNRLKQEYGLRAGFWVKNQLGIHSQLLVQAEEIFSFGQSFLFDLIIRIRLLDYLELSLGTGVWQDIAESRLGNQKKYLKFLWGIAIPF